MSTALKGIRSVPAMPEEVRSRSKRAFSRRKYGAGGALSIRGHVLHAVRGGGFRRITYSLDRPDVLSRYRTTIRGDGAVLPIMLSNGNEVSRQTLADGRQEVVEDPFPSPPTFSPSWLGISSGSRIVSLRSRDER